MSESKPGLLFLAGKWIKSSQTSPLQNPYTGETISNVSLASFEDLELATVAAQKAATVFSRQPRHERASLCNDIAAAISCRSEEFAQLITRESGKPIQYSRAEVSRCTITFTLAAHEAARFGGEQIPVDISPASEKLSAYTIRMPLGPVAAISPFNFPLNLVAHKLAPAFAVGCPVILKPSPQTPLTALLLAEVVHKAQAPPGALSILPMANDVAEAMVKDDRLRILSFTGSAAVGWHLKSISGRKRVLLELGGNAPAIIHKDADITHAVDRLVPASFASAGQVCIKSQRLIIHEAVYRTFLDKFIECTRAIKVGDPADSSTVVGPLINAAAADRVESWVEDAITSNANVLLKGTRIGNIIPPIILAEVPESAKCIQEEIFGPVVTVESYSNITGAIERANSTRYGLQAALFTFDTRIIEQAVRDLHYGGIIINDAPSVRVDNYPYGGTKDSGFGREGVRYTMEEYTEPKVIVTRSLL